MATYQTDSFSGLAKLLIPIIRDALAEVGIKVNQLMKENVDKYVYRAGSQTNYYANGTMQPTFELRDSIKTDKAIVKGNEAEVRVYHDSDFMSVEPDEFIHGSNYWKTYDIRDILPEIVNYGLSGDFFGSGWWQKPRPYYDMTVEELVAQGKLKLWFIQALKKRGITAV